VAYDVAQFCIQHGIPLGARLGDQQPGRLGTLLGSSLEGEATHGPTKAGQRCVTNRCFD
jgi:hypothetical protein